MKRLSRNLLSLFSADMMRRVLGFVSVAYLARVLGKEDFGAVNLGFAVLAYGMIFSAAGFPTLGAKRIAQGDSPELIGRVIGSRMVATVLVLSIIVCTVLIGVHNTIVAWLIIIFSCAVLPQIFFVDWFFQGKETMGIVSAARVLQSVIYLAVVLGFVRSSNDVLWVALGVLIGECTAAIMLFARFRVLYHNVRIHVRPSFELLKQSLPLTIGIVLSTIVFNYPPLALGLFNTTADVGIYSAASKLVYFLLMGDRILLLLLLPTSARKHHDAPETFRKLLDEAVWWILLVSLPIAVGGTVVADDLIVFIFGMEYVSSAAVLKVLIWYFFFTMLHTTYTSGLIGAGGEKAYGKIMGITALAYVVLVSAGAIWFGPPGAACGVVIAEGLSVVLMNRALRFFVLMAPPKRMVRIVLSVLLMAICVVSIAPLGLWWTLLAGAGSYCGMILLLRAVEWNDVKLLLARF